MSFSATPENRIGWKEMGFVEGQIVTCFRNVEKDKPNEDFWKDRLTIGKQYKIDDLEWRFWDRVCVVTDYSGTGSDIHYKYHCLSLRLNFLSLFLFTFLYILNFNPYICIPNH